MALSNQSNHFMVQGSGRKPYTVTINYATGHWCTCRGMLSKKGTFGDEAGRTPGTCCKHIVNIINDEFNGDWGTKTKSGARLPKNNPKPASMPLPKAAPTGPSGRRAAIAATKAREEERTKFVVEVNEAQEMLEQELDLANRIARLENMRTD